MSFILMSLPSFWRQTVLRSQGCCLDMIVWVSSLAEELLQAPVYLFVAGSTGN